MNHTLIAENQILPSLRSKNSSSFMTKLMLCSLPLSMVLCVRILTAAETKVVEPATNVVGLTLPEILKRAEKNAALVKDLKALKRTAQLKMSEVNVNRWLPTFDMKVFGGVVPDATVNRSNVNDYRSNELENGLSFGDMGGFVRGEINAIQPIYTFGKISAFEDMASHAPAIAGYEGAKKISELRQIVKRAFYTLQLAIESIAILAEVEQKLDDAANKVEELLVKNADNVSEVDRLKIRVFMADSKTRRLDAERAQRLSRSALAEIAGLSGEWDIEPRSLIAEEMAALKKEDVISAALRAKPEINQLSEFIGVKEAEYRTAKADLFPTFFIGGKVDYAKAPGRTDIDNPYLVDDFNYLNYGVVLGLKQDLGFFRTSNRMDQLKAEIDRLMAQRDQLIIKSKLDAERSFEEAVSAADGIKVNEDGFRAARSWLTSAGLSFNLGTSETKDVLESFAAYFKARADLIKSIYTLNLALMDLSGASGVEVVERLKGPNESIQPKL